MAVWARDSGALGSRRSLALRLWGWMLGPVNACARDHRAPHSAADTNVGLAFYLREVNNFLLYLAEIKR